jgi:hypothetical protein
MISRTELEQLTLAELKELGRLYCIEPVSDFNDRESWIRVLSTFGEVAMKQLDESIGIKEPNVSVYWMLETALDCIGKATAAQQAVIRAYELGRSFGDAHRRRRQQKLHTYWEVWKKLSELMMMLDSIVNDE